MAQYSIKSQEGVNYVELLLDNEMVRTESGAMRFIHGQIKMESKSPGIGGMFKAALTGESIFRPTYTGTGRLVLEPSMNSFYELNLQNEGYVLDRGAYWASDGAITVDAQANKLMAGFAGGEGWVQTRVSGTGKVILMVPGPVQIIDLVNDRMVVDGSFAVARSTSLDFKVERSTKSMIGSMTSGEGIVNVFEGTGRLFLAPVPNKYVMLQDMILSMRMSSSG
jgi:uncharacterized protein (AIM24 family)